MLLIKNFNKITLLNLIISLIPLNIIIGNLATNINIFIIILLGVFIFGKKIFFIEKKILNFLIYVFFFYLIIITYLNYWSHVNENYIFKENIIKSIFYLRFLLLFLIINKLIENRAFDTNLFFNSCAFFSSLVALDIVIQFLFKKNIIGLPIIIDKPSSFFGQENIAGGFLQRFILFFIFLLIIKKNTKAKINFYILIIFIIFLIPIILTGNRMPFMIYILMCMVYFVLEKKIIKIFLILLLSSMLIFVLSKTKISNRLHDDINSFFSESYNIFINAPKLFLENEIKLESGRNDYVIIFNSGIQIWKENKIFGNGLKSIRVKCTYEKHRVCTTHPHNYVIEIMSDAGLIGIILIYSILLLGFLNFFKFYYKEKNINIRLMSYVFFLLIFVEFFPIRSTGSFFTTNNSIFIYLILPIFLNIEKLKKL